MSRKNIYGEIFIITQHGDSSVGLSRIETEIEVMSKDIDTSDAYFAGLTEWLKECLQTYFDSPALVSVETIKERMQREKENREQNETLIEKITKEFL